MKTIALLTLLSTLVASTLAQSGPRGYIGLRLADAPGSAGAIVDDVMPGGPADRAGLKPGDLIVAINGSAINSATTMTRTIGAMDPNQTARLSIVRGGGFAAQRLMINVVIGSSGAPANSPVNAPPPAAPANSPATPVPHAAAPAANTAAAATAAQTAATSALQVTSYTHLTDPLEQAFTLDVPAGWQSTAGLARRAPLQINPYVRSVSPDKMTYLLIGDPALPTFAPPTQMGNAIGHREGTFYDAGLGGLALVMRYLPGAQFARSYGETMLQGLCPGLKFESAQERPDLAQKASAAAPTVIPSQVDGGEARFTCTHNKQPMTVVVDAATRITRDNIMWAVILLGGFIAPQPQATAAGAILAHMATSITYSPAWVQKQNNMSQQAAQQISLHMQDFLNHERTVIQQFNAADQNFESVDELVSGFSTYHDAKTGNDYSLSNTNPNKWIDDSSGRIVSTPTNTPPPWGPAYRALPRK